MRRSLASEGREQLVVTIKVGPAHIAANKFGKFALHVLMLEQAPPCVRGEGNQKVDGPSPRKARQA